MVSDPSSISFCCNVLSTAITLESSIGGGPPSAVASLPLAITVAPIILFVVIDLLSSWGATIVCAVFNPSWISFCCRVLSIAITLEYSVCGGPPSAVASLPLAITVAPMILFVAIDLLSSWGANVVCVVSDPSSISFCCNVLSTAITLESSIGDGPPRAVVSLPLAIVIVPRVLSAAIDLLSNCGVPPVSIIVVLTPGAISTGDLGAEER